MSISNIQSFFKRQTQGSGGFHNLSPFQGLPLFSLCGSPTPLSPIQSDSGGCATECIPSPPPKLTSKEIILPEAPTRSQRQGRDFVSPSDHLSSPTPVVPLTSCKELWYTTLLIAGIIITVILMIMAMRSVVT